MDYEIITPYSDQREKVLRDTYSLLAVSLLPTVAGAYIGLSFDVLKLLGNVTSFLLFLAGSFGLFYLIEKNKDSYVGVVLLLVFTFLAGLMLSGSVGAVLGMKGGAYLVMAAFAGTAGVFVAMSCLSRVVKQDISGVGKWLFVGLIVLIVGSVVNVLLGSTIVSAVISIAAIGLFSVFMLYDLKQIIDGGETNYIVATLSLYLDIVNMFQSILELFSIFWNDE